MKKAPRPSTPQRSNYLLASAPHHGPAWEWAQGHASMSGILSLEMQTTYTCTCNAQNSDGWTPRLTHTKGGKLVLSSNVKVSWNWPTGTAKCMRNAACQHRFKVGSLGLEFKLQKLTGEALWPKARPGKHFYSTLRVKRMQNTWIRSVLTYKLRMAW